MRIKHDDSQFYTSSQSGHVVLAASWGGRFFSDAVMFLLSGRMIQHSVRLVGSENRHESYGHERENPRFNVFTSLQFFFLYRIHRNKLPILTLRSSGKSAKCDLSLRLWAPTHFNNTGKVHFLGYAAILNVFFTPRNQVIVALMWSKAIATQQCVTTKTSRHSCTNAVEALAAKAEERWWSVGQSPWSNNRWVPGPTRQAYWGRAWVLEPQDLNKKPRLGQGVGGIVCGCLRSQSPEGPSPVNGEVAGTDLVRNPERSNMKYSVFCVVHSGEASREGKAVRSKQWLTIAEELQ
jgi:hypothetical protein